MGRQERTGFSVSFSVLKNKKLSPQEVLVYSYLRDLDLLENAGTTITNKELSEVFGISVTAISQIISKLKGLNYIQVSIDKDVGNVRSISLDQLF